MYNRIPESSAEADLIKIRYIPRAHNRKYWSRHLQSFSYFKLWTNGVSMMEGTHRKLRAMYWDTKLVREGSSLIFNLAHWIQVTTVQNHWRSFLNCTAKILPGTLVPRATMQMAVMESLRPIVQPTCEATSPMTAVTKPIMPMLITNVG